MKPHPAIPNTPDELLALLRTSPTGIPWLARLAAAQRLQQPLEAGESVEQIVEILELFADDPKPEVRHTVAQLTALLADEDFNRVAPKLEGDSHYYVRQAMARAIRKRRQAQKAASRHKLGFDEISSQLRQIESEHGTAAAEAAWRLCERYTHLLVGSMVHDLRSILNHLRDNAVKLAAVAEKAGTTPRVSQRLRFDVDFLERTVLDMERFTLSPRSKMVPVRMLDLVQSAREQAEAAVRTDGSIDPARVKFEIQVPDTITVSVVSHMIVSALANILKNALEAFVQPDERIAAPAIWISVSQTGEWAQLVVRDNGKGFSSEEEAALKPFTPGRRNKTKKNSTGYGLPNAMRNISAHGGTVEIDTQENRGTTITIRLPLKMSLAGNQP